jgi:lipopolysaccharide biosynthesis glycosyltransferase
MHIVTASDENYALGVLVLIASAHRHNPSARFSVLTTQWSADSLAKLRDLSTRLDLRVDCIEISADRLSSLSISRAHLTAVTYSRLFIPDLLPNEDRVIYMDSDMLVTGSLQAAWECDLACKVLAAVRCPSPSPTDVFAAAIYLPLADYFNAGFLVMNLGLWRAEGLAQICLDRITAPDCPYLSQDESALNDVARGRVNYLAGGFNLFALDILWQAPFDAPQTIAVIHYISGLKPWNGLCPFGALWWAELGMTPELARIAPPVETWSTRLSRWNLARKAYFGERAGKPQYHRYRDARRRVWHELMPQYLKTGRFAL